MIREHVQEHGTAPDGRLFRTYRGGIYLPSTLWRVLQEARSRVLTPAQFASPLARKGNRDDGPHLAAYGCM